MKAKFVQLLATTASFGASPGGGLFNMPPSGGSTWSTLYALDDRGQVWWLSYNAETQAMAWLPIESPEVTTP